MLLLFHVHLKALNRCFLGWSPIDQHLYLFSQLASTLQWWELDVLSHLAWTQVVLWREKCAPSTHTSHSSPFILYPPIPTSGVLGARGLVCLKSFCMHFLWEQRLKCWNKERNSPIGKQKEGGESSAKWWRKYILFHFFSVFYCI